MKKFESGSLFESAGKLLSLGLGKPHGNFVLPISDYERLQYHLHCVQTMSIDLDLATTLASCKRLIGITQNYVKIKEIKELGGNAAVFDDFIGTTFKEQLRNMTERLCDELSNKTAFIVPLSRASLLDSDKPLFGVEVFIAFPSANYDIKEAGNCLALDRNTACVMHLMRVAEVGLSALAKTVGVTKKANDWGSYLREIEKELAVRAKTSGARSAAEQFYAEAAVGFDHVKRAWRNPTMHVDRAYSSDRADEIFQSVKSMMRHLATQVKEAP